MTVRTDFLRSCGVFEGLRLYYGFSSCGGFIIITGLLFTELRVLIICFVLFCFFPIMMIYYGFSNGRLECPLIISGVTIRTL